MPLIKINDKELEVPAGQTILEAAKTIGIEIPHYCYHRALKIVASCRMCLVEMAGVPKLVPACSTPISELPAAKKIENRYDAVIFTESPKVLDARAGVLEFLLLNHPIDCPICDKAGECKLQDYSFEHGYDESRFIDFKRIPRKKDLGPTIYLYTSRCILCSRCVRFLEEITGTEELKIFHRGSHSEIDIIPGRPLNNPMMANVVDLCPVGCLIDKHERFEGRVWNFIQIDSICPGCSKGCNITLDVMKKDKLNLEEWIDKVYRIRPRENPLINQFWICDEGRYYLESFKNRKRILTPLLRDNGIMRPITWKEALHFLAEQIRHTPAEHILITGSPYASNEENYLLAKLAETLGTKTALIPALLGLSHTFVPKNGQPVFTIEAEKAPNSHGLKNIFSRTTTPLNLFPTDTIRLALVFSTPHASSLPDKRPEKIVLISYYEDDQTASADLILPAAMFYETSGTYTNKDGLTQKFNRAIFLPGEIREGWRIIQDIANALELDWKFESEAQVAKEMFENVRALQSINIKHLYPTANDEEMIL